MAITVAERGLVTGFGGSGFRGRRQVARPCLCHWRGSGSALRLRAEQGGRGGGGVGDAAGRGGDAALPHVWAAGPFLQSVRRARALCTSVSADRRRPYAHAAG